MRAYIEGLYVALCKRWGPENLTLSAYSWKLYLAGDKFWANRIDGAALLLFGQRQHCEQQLQRERGR